MKIGYARVSTEDQKLDLQLSALKRAGCERIFEDRGVSGAKMSRPGLEKMLRTMRPGQTLVVWRLDRLGRCLIPRFDGAILSQEWKEALWARFVTEAPRPRTPSELQYNDRKLRSRR